MGMGLYGWRAKCGQAGEQKNGQSLQRKPGWKCANKMATPDKIPLGLEISMVCLFRFPLPSHVANGACRSTNSKLVSQKVKGQTVQGQMAQEF